MSEEYINYNELEDMEYLCKLLEQRDEDIKTFKFTITTQQQMIDELINKIDKAINLLKNELKDYYHPIADFEIIEIEYPKVKELLEILGGNNETI